MDVVSVKVKRRNWKDIQNWIEREPVVPQSPSLTETTHRISKECWMKDNNFGYIYIHRSDIKPNDNTKTSSSINFDCGKRSVSIVIPHSVVVHHFNVSGVPFLRGNLPFTIVRFLVLPRDDWMNDKLKHPFASLLKFHKTLNIEDAKRLLRLLKRFSNHFVVIW